jgi:hypothetical protein
MLSNLVNLVARVTNMAIKLWFANYGCPTYVIIDSSSMVSEICLLTVVPPNASYTPYHVPCKTQPVAKPLNPQNISFSTFTTAGDICCQCINIYFLSCGDPVRSGIFTLLKQICDNLFEQITWCFITSGCKRRAKDGCISGFILRVDMMLSRRVGNFKTLHGKHLHDTPVGFNVLYLFCPCLQI